MQSKLIPLFLFCFFTSTGLASTVTCPTVTEIQQGQFKDWLPLYQQYEELASVQDVALFKAHVTGFKKAVWDRKYLENGHCYYVGNDPIINKIVFAQDAWRPAENAQWQNVRAECRSEVDCRFQK